MAMAKDAIEKLRSCAADLRQMGQPHEGVARTAEHYKDQLKGVHMALSGSMRRRSARVSSGGWEEPSRSFQDAMAWISQQKRLIETSPWGDDPTAIEQQLLSQQMFHSSIQRSAEVDRARDELVKKGDKGNLHALDQEWDSLQKLSFLRSQQLREVQQVLQDMSAEIMWVNDREEEELMFDWGDKNIDVYIPRKQESYSKLMSALEDKEKHLNKLKTRVDNLLKNQHPAADKIEAYRDTLQTQWSWLLQITKCIDVHLKENAAYSQFFKDANETYKALQKEHELVRKRFTCDKDTSLEDLLELLRGLEKEKEKITEQKRQVQRVVNKSKSIVRLKPRNPEERGGQVIVKALCDFKQDQKVICKGDEAILKDNSHRSKWEVTGPGGLHMEVPSVCLLVPPPNPLSVSLANKNEQYYEAILSIWNQLYINVKSLISWQHCLLDIQRINSLTLSMLAQMRPEEYRQIIKSLESHYEEFKVASMDSQMFAEEDKRSMESQFTGAQSHYEQLVVQLPTYVVQQGQLEAQQADAMQLIFIQQQTDQEEALRLEEEQRRLEEERRRLEEERRLEAKRQTPSRAEPGKKRAGSSAAAAASSRSLSELHGLWLKLEALETSLGQHVHVCLGEEAAQDCGLKMAELETLRRDLDLLQQDHLTVRERILREADATKDADKAQFLRSDLAVISRRLGGLEGSSSACLQRLRALRDMLESLARAEDVVKVHEARLTEKETTSLWPAEVEAYVQTLKNLQSELEQKQSVVSSMEAELTNATHWNDEVGGAWHRCDMMLGRYSEQVGQLSDRWKRIQNQIGSRLQELRSYLPQLQRYRQSSESFSSWIEETRKRQESLQATKTETPQALMEHMDRQKALNSEIKAKRETLDSILKENQSCVSAVKDYETDVASYTSGLETLLNIPIKRTMLKSPTTELTHQATQLQTRYMELLTQSGDYHRFLGELLKNMEELKMRDTRMELLEEELRLLKEGVQERSATNRSLEEALARCRLQLSQSQEQLLSMEEVKRSAALQCSATQDSLDSSHGQLSELREQLERLTYLLEEEKRKRRLAEERYTQQQSEYEAVLRKRQSELETVSWSKVELEKDSAGKDRETALLRRQLAEEAGRAQELQADLSQVSTSLKALQSQYKDVGGERDALLLKLQATDRDRDRVQRLEEEVSRLKFSLDSELSNKQRLQAEQERSQKDLGHWKEQLQSKQTLLRQCDLDRERLEREKSSLESEVQRLMRELRELEGMYQSKLSSLQSELSEVTVVRQTVESELRRVKELPTLDDSAVYLDGVRKAVTASQLFQAGLLDKPTFSQLVKGHKSVAEVSADKKPCLKGTGPIAGVLVEGRPGRGSSTGPFDKLTLTEAKQRSLLARDCADLLLDAQAATGHLVDPRTGQRLTVDEACTHGLADEEDRRRLLAAEAAAVGYVRPGADAPLSVAQAAKQGLVNKNTALRLLQAQESVGGILDPALSVFVPKDKAVSRELIDEDVARALAQKPELYLDPETEGGATYMALKQRCKVDPQTGLLLLPVSETQDLSQIIFDGVRKPVSAQQLLDCGVLDKQTCKDLAKGRKSVAAVSADIGLNLKGRGPISGVIAGTKGKMSFSEAKKLCLIPAEAAELLLEAQAATGHVVDPTANQKLTVEDACARGLVDAQDRERLLAAEAAAVGIPDPGSAKPLSAFQAMRKGLMEEKTALRLLQAQDCAGGILDPTLSVFLPKETAIGRDLLDERLSRILKQNPECFLDPDSDRDVSYGDLKRRTKTEPHTGLMLLSVIERKDPSKLLFDGVRKQVSAQQLLDCGILDKPTFSKLVKGERTVEEVAADKKVHLKGTGPIVGIVARNQGIMSLTDAKKHNLLISDSLQYLLEAQVATGYIIDPKSNDKLTVEEACARGVVDLKDRERLLVAEGAVVGYKDPGGVKPLSVFEAMKKGIVDRRTALRLLQAQESAGGILDPVLSVFLPKELAIRRNILDESTHLALSQRPPYYLDPEPEHDISYGALKQRCRTETDTGVLLLPISEWEVERQRARVDPSTLLFQGVRKPVTAQQLLDCGLLNTSTYEQLVGGEKTVAEVSASLASCLSGSGPIAGVAAGPFERVSFTEAKRSSSVSADCADRLLEAQAATGYIVDPQANQRLTVREAVARGVVDKLDESRLLAAEAAAIGYRDPSGSKLLSAGQALRKGLVDKDTVLRLLQAQEAVGGVVDPNLSVFLPREMAMNRNIIDADLYQALSRRPPCYLDPETQRATTYADLLGKCAAEPSSGLLLLPESQQPATVQGLRGRVPLLRLVGAHLLDQSDLDRVRQGRLTSRDIESRLRPYLAGSSCIAGVFDEARKQVLPFYRAMKDELLRPGTTLELLEAQAASGFMVDPVNNLYLNVADAYGRHLFGADFKDSLLSAERAVTGHRLPGTSRVLSLFQAMEEGLVERGHAIRLLEAQLASGGIIDPEGSHRIDVETAYQKGYLDQRTHEVLTQGGDGSKAFVDPNTEETVTYRELKRRCITDEKTGLLLLPVVDKKAPAASQKNTLRKRRVVIVDPETNKEMSVRQAYDKGYIDHETFVELSEQECEWEEISTTAPDGSTHFMIVDRQSGKEYNISRMLEEGLVGRSALDQYRSGVITLTQFADLITSGAKRGSAETDGATARELLAPSAYAEVSRPLSPTFTKTTTTKTTITERSSSSSSSSRHDALDPPTHVSGISLSPTSPPETLGEKSAIGAVFDTEALEKISITEAQSRGLVDAITAQRLLEAQACTGGIVNPSDGRRLGLQEASRQGIITDDMAAKLKPAQKAYTGFEDVKSKRKLSVAQAVKEMWLPYEAGQRLMEYQCATGGLHDPEAGCRRSLDQAVRMSWLEARAAQSLRDPGRHSKTLTCPKSKLKVSYQEALDNAMLEEGTGVRMLQASAASSQGISSPYNVTSAPGSSAGSRSGSRRGSRRSSFDSGSASLSSRYGGFSSRSNF
ncbi:LOW QUALITY PROTEIN: desmoplakin-B-like [Synchiropus picturatus]